MAASGGAIVLDLVAKEDLALGTGLFQQVHPNGGTQIASRINLATFSFLDQSQADAVPALGANGIYNNSVACPGASLGDQVLVSFSGATSGTFPVLVYGCVAAGDIVKVTYFAPQGCIALAGTLRITVFKR